MKSDMRRATREERVSLRPLSSYANLVQLVLAHAELNTTLTKLREDEKIQLKASYTSSLRPHTLVA